MHDPIYKRSLLRGLLAGAVILSVAACSRPDRADAGDDTTQATSPDAAVAPADTQPRVAAVDKDRPVSGYQPMETKPAKPSTNAGETATADTGSVEVAAAAADTDTGQIAASADTTTVAPDHQAGHPTEARTDTVAVGDSTNMGKVGERIDSSAAADQANADTMTGQPESDRVRPPEDSSETLGAVTSDTGTLVARADTGTQTPADTLGQAPADSAAIQVQADTTTADQPTDVAVEAPTDTAAMTDTVSADQQTEVVTDTQPDTAAVVGDSSQVGKTGERLDAVAATPENNEDTLATESERVRPPEDSAEVHGNVSGEQRQSDAEVSDADAAPVAGAGVQPAGPMVTGAEAVALMSREGQRCAVVSGDEAQDAQWDLASSPATMNPCGTGTMTLPRVQTGEDR